MEEFESLNETPLMAAGADPGDDDAESLEEPESFDDDGDSGNDSDEWDDDEDEDNEDYDDWVTIGYTSDKVTADYIVDSLQSYEIPATIMNKSGFLGDIGLPLAASPFSGGAAAYEILTPADSAEEAIEIAGMVAGDKWEPVD